MKSPLPSKNRAPASYAAATSGVKRKERTESILTLPPAIRHVAKRQVRASMGPATISQGTAAMSRSATPAMKKAVVDRQTTFVNEKLYDCVKEVGEELSLEDPTWLFSFYYAHLKPHLDKLIDGVRSLKTGGKDAPHISRFTPLNKFMVMDLDYIDIAEGVRSEKQLKFYKMVIYKIFDCASKGLKDSGFKGKICLKKGFYSKLDEYWKGTVYPEIEASKKESKEELEEGEVEEESAEMELNNDGELISTASQQGGAEEEECSLAQEMPLTP